MIFTLKNCIQPDIVGLVGGGSQRGTTLYHVRQIRTDIRMDPQDQTLWEDQKTISIGGKCDG